MKSKPGIPDGDIIIGRNTVRELLRVDPARIIKLYTSEKDGPRRLFSGKDFQLFESAKIPFEVLSKDRLSALAKSDSHQSVLAIIKKRAEIGIKDFLRTQDKETSLVVMLSEIQDPQNFGAILRAAECFSADLVIYGKNKGAPMTPTVSKASVGASELLNIAGVSNLADTLSKLKSAGYWAVLADADPGAESIGRFEFPKRTVLILGSEGLGAQALLKKESDFKVFIEISGRISSLNVSQAAAVFFEAFRRQHPVV